MAEKTPSTGRRGRTLYRDVANRGGKAFNLDRQAQYLELIAGGTPRIKAAKIVGTTWAAVKRHREADPAFADSETEAEASRTEDAETALWDIALGKTTGVPNFEALKFILINRDGERWQSVQKRTVTHEGTVTHELEPGQAMQRIMELQSRLEERRALSAGGVIDVEPVDDEEPGSL